MNETINYCLECSAQKYCRAKCYEEAELMLLRTRNSSTQENTFNAEESNIRAVAKSRASNHCPFYKTRGTSRSK
jgi:hypothetical protein